MLNNDFVYGVITSSWIWAPAGIFLFYWGRMSRRQRDEKIRAENWKQHTKEVQAAYKRGLRVGKASVEPKPLVQDLSPDQWENNPDRRYGRNK